VKFVKEEEPEL